MVGGNGRKTIRIAAKHADEWNCVGSADTCAAGAALLREACAEIGRDFNQLVLSAHPNFSVAATHEQAEARARALAESADQNLDETRDRWVLGTPAEVMTQLQRYSDAGFTHWVFGVGAPFDLEGLRLFAQEVIPALS
jgi:alkanesulfonate monooxygenase SsuD/methylene tetrahydromethanopterin reductase-like flavin-dependent oxidoreductase (luciferase family)